MRVDPTLAAVLCLSLAFLACERETPVRPPADPRDAKLAQLQKENERLRAEGEAAQRSTAELDATLRTVESELGTLVGIDGDISALRRDIESGVKVRSARKNVRNLMDRLRTALKQRESLISKAQTNLTKAKEQADQQEASVREAYLHRVSQLEQLIQQQVEENMRLVRERDSFERLYRQAVAEANEARTTMEAVKVELDAERQQREEAERLQNRVFVIAAPREELRQKGVLTGRWYQRKSSNCVCTDCLAEEDRRTLNTVPIPAPQTRVRVLSSHPKDSFRVVATGTAASTLEIVDSEKFWSGSHCLVIAY